MTPSRFLAIEGRSPAPLAPLWVLAKGSVWASSLPGAVTFAAAVGVIFTPTLYMQQVLGYSPLQTGLAFAFMGVTSIMGGRAAPSFIARFGARIALVGGLLTQAAGTASLVLLTTGTGSLAILLVGIGITGFGHISTVVAFRSIAVSGLPDHEQGLASGLATATQQVGAALGVAILASVALARSDALQSAGVTAEDALTGGSHYAVATGAALLGLATVFAVAALPRTSAAEPATDLDANRGSQGGESRSRGNARGRTSHERCANADG